MGRVEGYRESEPRERKRQHDADADCQRWTAREPYGDGGGGNDERKDEQHPNNLHGLGHRDRQDRHESDRKGGDGNSTCRGEVFVDG